MGGQGEQPGGELAQRWGSGRWLDLHHQTAEHGVGVGDALWLRLGCPRVL